MTDPALSHIAALCRVIQAHRAARSQQVIGRDGRMRVTQESLEAAIAMDAAERAAVEFLALHQINGASVTPSPIPATAGDAARPGTQGALGRTSHNLAGGAQPASPVFFAIQKDIA